MLTPIVPGKIKRGLSPFSSAKTLARLALLAMLVASWPATAASANCGASPMFDGRAQLEALRDGLRADAFADAYWIFLDDIDYVLQHGGDLLDRMSAWYTSVCQPLIGEQQRYEAAVAGHNGGECGASEAPEDVVARCAARKTELDAWKANLERRGTDVERQAGVLNAEGADLDAIFQRAVLNASNLLDLDHTEQAFRLYIFHAVELDKSTASQNRDSCRVFARIATALGRRVTNQDLFIDYLVRNVVERRFDVNFFTGDPPLEPVKAWGREFGSRTEAFNAKGFKKTFYDNIAENQVRHVAGYMRSGYGFTGTAAQVVSLFSDVPKSEHADYRLAVEGGQMGWQLRRGRLTSANFGAAIESRLCD